MVERTNMAVRLKKGLFSPPGNATRMSIKRVIQALKLLQEEFTINSNGHRNTASAAHRQKAVSALHSTLTPRLLAQFLTG